jgi:hypothetical protein
VPKSYFEKTGAKVPPYLKTRGSVLAQANKKCATLGVKDKKNSAYTGNFRKCVSKESAGI